MKNDMTRKGGAAMTSNTRRSMEKVPRVAQIIPSRT